MQVISHFPKSADVQRALCKNLAEVQAKTVIERIKKMNLSEVETKRLITMICDKVQIAAGT
jgi:hypothetical protein